MSRRALLALVVVVLSAGACGSKQDHALPRHERRQSSPRLATVARDIVDRGVSVAWSTAADGAPVAVAADRRGEVVIIDHERVGSLDPKGRVLWVMNSDEVVNSVPALMGDRVIVPFTRTNGAGGCLGLDRETGEIRWRYEAIITGGVAVAAAGALVICVMQNGQTAGISPAWGAPKWEFTFQGDIDPSSIEVPAATEIAVDEVSGMFGFVVRLGDEWQLSTRSVETGHTRFDLGINLGSSGSPTAPALVGVGFFGVTSADGDFFLVSLRKADDARFRIPAGGGFDPATAPLRVGNLVIVAGRAGDVTAIDLDSVRPIWTVHGIGEVRGAHLIVLGKTLMLQTWSGQLVALRLTDGASVRLPWRPAQAIGMLFSGGPGAAIAVGQDGAAGWIERWEPKPGR